MIGIPSNNCLSGIDSLADDAAAVASVFLSFFLCPVLLFGCLIDWLLLVLMQLQLPLWIPSPATVCVPFTFHSLSFLSFPRFASPAAPNPTGVDCLCRRLVSVASLTMMTPAQHPFVFCGLLLLLLPKQSPSVHFPEHTDCVFGTQLKLSAFRAPVRRHPHLLQQPHSLTLFTTDSFAEN